MKQYLKLVKNVLDNGVDKVDRTGTGTRSIFGHQMRFNLSRGFPLVTTKKVHFKSIVHELIWMLSGTGNIKYLQDNNVKIWNEWANSGGFLGPVYGVQWRSWNYHVDQLQEVITSIKTNPNSRRHIVSAWNVTHLKDMALPPCHLLFQFYVSNGKLSCQLYQRSADVFLGVPFNIASYSILTHIIAQVCDLKVGEFIHTIGDAHIYNNHIDQCRLQLTRKPEKLPKLKLDPTIKDIDSFSYEHIKLSNYKSHPHIKGDISV